jgi:quercetin dioxygenase-like cupin family protein
MVAILAFALAWAAQSAVVLQNGYAVVTRNGAPCAAGRAPSCGDRIVVALGAIELRAGGKTRRMQRGDIAVFAAGRAYDPPAAGDFLEVTLRPDHPPVERAPVRIAPEKNRLLYDGARFFVFEEMLPPGETRARHSHNQRVVVVLNETELHQWPDGAPEVDRKQVPDDVHFNQPVVHAVKTTGKLPLRNIVIELK